MRLNQLAPGLPKMVIMNAFAHSFVLRQVTLRETLNNDGHWTPQI